MDGVIGPQTVRALAGDSVASRIEKVNLALERLRWLPSDLTERFVFLNAPSYRAQYFENGTEKLNMRAIYGNASRQTYFFKDRVSYVEFHPFWGVPRSILVNTYLSRLIDDPGYLEPRRFRGHQTATASASLRPPSTGVAMAPTFPMTSGRRRDRATLWANSRSCSPIGTRSTCTTRPIVTSSTAPTGRSAMAASVSTTRGRWRLPSWGGATRTSRHGSRGRTRARTSMSRCRSTSLISPPSRKPAAGWASMTTSTTATRG